MHLKNWLPLLLVSLCRCDDEPPRRRCTSDTDCTLPERCSTEGRCAVPDGLADGQPCLQGDQCQSRLCFDRGQGGSCARGCQGPGACAAGQSCVPAAGRVLPGATAEGRLVCQAPGNGQAFLGEACAGDGACRSGLCESGACTQPCGSCPALMVCDQTTLSREGKSVPTGICRTRLLDLIELGEVSVAQSSASSLTFEIPPGVESFLVFADDVDDLRVALTRLQAPDGAVLVDYASPDTALMRAYDYLGTGTAQVPGTDNSKAKVSAGSYELSVRTYEKRFDVMNPVAGSIDRVTVMSRRSRQKGGLLDLDLHFAPGTGITAAAAKTSPYVGEMLAELQALYSSLAGVGLGEVRAFDLTAAEDTVATADAARALRQKYSQAGARGLSVSVFIVTSMSFGFEAVAGGIPGVPGLAKRPSSGIVAQAKSSGKIMGRLLAHELGHYLGLFHTTESGAVVVDKIEDTPSCPSGTQINSCPDHANLMFPYYLNSADPLTLSAGQATVLRGSPFVYELVYPEACGPGTEVVDVSRGFASGSTLGAASKLTGSCGGAGGERVHLYRVGSPPPKGLEVEVMARGFDPVVYVLRGACTTGAPVVACESGAAGTPVKIALTALEAGPYFLVVDGETGGGTYSLTVR